MLKYALISPNESPIKYVSSWTSDTPPQPIFTEILNSCRVAEVANAKFEVAEPLFWVDCANDVIADQYYYNTNDNEIYPIPPTPPYPNS